MQTSRLQPSHRNKTWGLAQHILVLCAKCFNKIVSLSFFMTWSIVICSLHMVPSLFFERLYLWRCPKAPLPWTNRFWIFTSYSSTFRGSSEVKHIVPFDMLLQSSCQWATENPKLHMNQTLPYLVPHFWDSGACCAKSNFVWLVWDVAGSPEIVLKYILLPTTF